MNLHHHSHDHESDHACSGHSHSHSHSHSHGHSHDAMCGDDHSGDMCCSPPNYTPYISENKFQDKSKYEVANEFELEGIKYIQYKDETMMPLIMNLITKDLSEPYSIYTYRYFIHNWPYLCFLVKAKS